MFSKDRLVMAICWIFSIVTCSAVDVPATGVFPYSSSINVAYDVQGNGDLPIVLLHSLGSAKEAWDPLMPGLLAVCNCRVYRLDLKGHGDTSAPDDHHYSLHDNAELVRAFIADQGLHGAILAGHSYGGAVALSVALDAKDEEPGLLGGLVLIGTPGVMQRFPFVVAHHRYEAYGEFIDHVTTPKFRAWVAVHARNYSNSPGTRHRVELYTRLWADRARSRASRETARQFLDGGGLKELAARNHDTGVPTLLIAGERDHIVGVQHMKELELSIPGSKLAVIKKAGHSPQEDVPEALVPLISDFLRHTKDRDSLPRRLASSGFGVL